jgi:hypothetical protein
MVSVDVQLRKALVSHFKADQNLRDNADHSAICSESRFGYSLHEPDLGSAVDNADAAHGESAAKLFCGSFVGGMVPVGRGAEDSDVMNHEDRISTAMAEDMKVRRMGCRPRSLMRRSA